MSKTQPYKTSSTLPDIMDEERRWADTVSLIPILPNSKRPAIKWEEFQKRRATADEREEWKREFPGCNWAIVTGEVSELIALDWDGVKGRELRKEKKVYGGPSSITPSGGFHTLHAHPGRRVPNGVRLLGDESGGLDTRGDGGYIVCPPSVIDGKHYKWEFAPWMVGLTPAPEWVWPLIERGSGPGSSPDLQQDGLPLGVDKGQRNATAARLAGRYLARGLSAEETATILLTWNKKNSPPLSDQELRSVIFSIARKEREKSVSLEVIHAAELISSPAVSQPFLVAPFFPAGGKAILAGNSGVGKTMLAENIAYTVADGKLLFQRFNVARANVLYVDSESHPALTRVRVGRIAMGLQATHRGVSLIFPEKRLDLGIPKNREELCRRIDEVKAGLAILDSFLCFASLRSENDNSEVREWLERLNEIPKTTGAALLILDHAAKGTPERAKARTPLSARGAGAKQDWADCVMTFEEQKSDLKFLRTLRFPKTRFCAPVPALILEMDSNFVFTPSGEDETCPIFLVTQTVEQNPGIAAMKLYHLLMSLTGCSRPTADRAARKAAELGSIIREEKGKYVNYYPRLGNTKTGDFPNLEEDENGGQKSLVYQ